MAPLVRGAGARCQGGHRPGLAGGWRGAAATRSRGSVSREPEAAAANLILICNSLSPMISAARGGATVSARQTTSPGNPHRYVSFSHVSFALPGSARAPFDRQVMADCRMPREEGSPC